jgi:hypothetical protein
MASAIYLDLDVLPNKEIDVAWHCHILDLQKYADDCNFLFQRFMHHDPRFEEDTQSPQLIEKTREIWRRYYKEELFIDTVWCGKGPDPN